VKQVQASVEIAAAPEQVWRILTDFDSFPSWNPFMTRVEGRPEVGAKPAVTIQPPGGREMTFKPKVLEVEENRRLRWVGRWLMPGLFDGEHTLQIEPTGDGGSRFVQSERFRGVLTWFSGRMLGRTHAGFEAMNAALKERCEAGSGGA
jgi:hypothetical protein